MTTTEAYWTLQTAHIYGGGFLGRLAEAGILADPNNRQRLMAAFPEIEQCFGPQTRLYAQVRNP
jgi:hypothetical protein